MREKYFSPEFCLRLALSENIQVQNTPEGSPAVNKLSTNIPQVHCEVLLVMKIACNSLLGSQQKVTAPEFLWSTELRWSFGYPGHWQELALCRHLLVLWDMHSGLVARLMRWASALPQGLRGTSTLPWLCLQPVVLEVGLSKEPKLCASVCMCVCLVLTQQSDPFTSSLSSIILLRLCLAGKGSPSDSLTS